MSKTTDAYLAELEAADAEAASFLEQADPDQHGITLVRTLRAALKRRRTEIDTIRAELRTEARQELIRERQTEAGFRRLNVPPSARGLFADVDPTDQAAMAARADELRQAGVSWPGIPQPPGPPPPDPALLAQQAMQAAASGAVTLESAGDLKARMLDMKANPGKYSDEQHAAVVGEYNRAVDAAARKGGAGVMG